MLAATLVGVCRLAGGGGITVGTGRDGRARNNAHGARCVAPGGPSRRRGAEPGLSLGVSMNGL